ncbi:MAG: hypothetical protein ACJ786_07675 [Catenulispora sp.]
MVAISGSLDPDAALAAKYPYLEHPAHVAHWLGWVAYRMGAARSFPRWQPASWVPAVYLAVARWTAIACLTVPLCVVSVLTMPPVVIFPILVGRRVITSLAGKPGTPWEMPKALKDRRPELPWWRPTGDAVRRLLRIALTVVFPAYLRGIWGVSPGSGAGPGRRAQRRNDLLYVAVWLLGSAELPLFLLALDPGAVANPLSTALWELVAVVGIIAFLTRPSLTDSAFAEVVLTVQWRTVPRFRRTFAEAVRHGVLRQEGDDFAFGDAELRCLLSDAHSATLGRRQRVKDEQAARSGMRAGVVELLKGDRFYRIAFDLGLGVACGLSLLVSMSAAGWSALGLIPLMVIPGFVVLILALPVLSGMGSAARWSLANVAITSRRARAAVALAAIGIGVLLAVECSRPSIVLLTAVLPAVCAASCALWLTVLAVGRRRRSRHIVWRLAPDLGVVTGTAITSAALLRRDVVTATPAAGLLFPIAVWLCIKAWRGLQRSDRLLRKAGADIVLAVLLGGVLVLFLVWLANVLDISKAEFASWRSTFVEVDSRADRPWWNWAAIFTVLSALTFAFAAAPNRMAAVRRHSDRWKIAPGARVVERVLKVTHIALMAVVLSAVAVPHTVAPIHNRQLAAAYTLALQREADIEQDLAAFREVMADAAAGQRFTVLRAMFLKVHELDPPGPGHHRATATEQQVAHRLGHDQAEAAARSLNLPTAADPRSPVDTTAPVSNSPEQRVEAAEAAERNENDREKQAESAAEFASAALAQSLSIPDVGGSEVVDIVREYLSGLVEDGRIKDVLARRFSRLAARSVGTSDQDLLDPVPENLDQAAIDDLSGEFIADGYADPIAGFGHADPALEAARAKPPLDAAVDHANHARFVHDGGHGPCAGCTRPKTLSEEHGFGEHGTGGGGEHPIRIP